MIRRALAIAALISLASGCRREGHEGTAAATPPPSASAAKGPSGPIPVDVVTVTQKVLDTTTHLQGELAPFEAVSLYPRTSGFVTSVAVDRGSQVKRGQVLLRLTAPELSAQRAEVEAKQSAERSTLDRLRAASHTEGAVAGHDIELADAAFRASGARIQALRTLEGYLTLTAPFDGVVTERNVHPGALVGPPTGPMTPALLRVEQVAKLRLTASVPEHLVSSVVDSAVVSFTVRAWPGRAFSGAIRRQARSVDPKTRAMPVELDVDNADGQLTPGMYADVAWPVRRPGPSIFVPPSSVVQSTEKTFVVRIKDGAADQVPVQRGVQVGDLLEVFGPLAPGDVVAQRGTEELRPGTRVEPRAKAAPAGSAH